MTLVTFPMIERGEPDDAAALRATLRRTHDLRYGMNLTFLVARLAVWLVRIDRRETASVVEGWLGTHLPRPIPTRSGQLSTSSTNCSAPAAAPTHDHEAPP